MDFKSFLKWSCWKSYAASKGSTLKDKTVEIKWSVYIKYLCECDGWIDAKIMKKMVPDGCEVNPSLDLPDYLVERQGTAFEGINLSYLKIQITFMQTGMIMDKV